MRIILSLTAIAHMFFVATQTLASEACDELFEARVCAAGFPWEPVDSFPFGQFNSKPVGRASVFHMNGRGVGVIEGIARSVGTTVFGATALANYWTDVVFDDQSMVPDGEWETSQGKVGEHSSVTKRIFLRMDGRRLVLRGTFVATEIGDVIIYSLLNTKTNDQAGDYLHNSLIEAVELRSP